MFNLRLQQASAQLEKPARLRTLRKDIARIETRISQLRTKRLNFFVWLKTINPTEVKRGNRKERVGEVVSNKMTKTIVVKVERRFPHPQYKKIVTAYTKFYAHDEKMRPRLAIACALKKHVRFKNQVLAARGGRRTHGAGNTGGGLI